MKLLLRLAFTIIALAFAAAGSASAAPSLPFAAETQVRFRNLTLPNDANFVQTLLQDSRGMLWLGTKRGIFCYNGYSFHRCYYGSN